MKNLILCTFFLLGTLNLLAQANNNTLDTWRINYYGAITTVPPSTPGVTINIGSDCAQGISVSLVGGLCSHVFNTPTPWMVGCAPNTSSVDFSATSSGFGCQANPVT